MTQNLVIPSKIPWDEIKGVDLEELLYWLFDSMGAKDLEWRKGGRGSGSADQGRDLECSFYTSTPEGNLARQKWWIEAKGRASTVEPTDLKESVLNASGKQNVDVLVIATNSYFSNPTRDWVTEWQFNHPRPVIKLWERSHLERLCSKHPLTVIRFYSKALTPQGKLEVARTKLWNYAVFTDKPALQELWENANNLTISAESLFALVASEFANGDICERSWAALASKELVIETLTYALINSLYLVSRVSDAGTRQEPLIRAFSHLVLVGIDKVGDEQISRLLVKVWDDVDGREYPEEIRNYILCPILDTLISEIRDVCTSDCTRISTDPSVLSAKEIKTYWKRLVVQPTNKRKDEGILTIESLKAPCKIGFGLDKEKTCPICFLEDPEKNISHVIGIVQEISKLRRAQDQDEEDV